MVGEQLQSYVNLVGGLTRATKAKAAEAAQGLLSAAGLDDVAADASERVTNLADEIIAASRANRELLLTLIGTEVDKAAARMGFARSEDLETLRGEVAELRAALAGQSARARTAEAAATEATVVAAAAALAAEEAATTANEAAVSMEEAVAAPPPRAASARKAGTSKTTTNKAPATKTPTATTAAKKAAKKAAAKKSPAKRAAVKKAPVSEAATE